MKFFKFFLFGLLSMVTAFGSSSSLSDGLDAARSIISEHTEVIYIAGVSPIIALNTYAGKYEKALFSTALNGMEITGDVRVIRALKSKMQMTELLIGDGVRPYNKTEQIRATMEYKPRVLEADLWKREEEIEIKEYYETWLEEQLAAAEGSSATQKRIPFAQDTWNQFLAKIYSEINDKTTYHGFDKSDAVAFAPGDTYSAGDYITYTSADGIEDYWKCEADTSAGEDPEDTPAKWTKVNAEAITPGFGYRIQELIDASLLTATTIGAIDNNNVYAYAAFTELFRALAKPYRKMGVIAYCSYTDFDYLLDDFEVQVGKYTESERNWVNNRGIYLPKSNRKCLVLPCTWMDGTRRIIMTPMRNMLMGTDMMSDYNKIAEVKSELWTAKYGVSGNLGFQIQDPKAMVINDQA